jgi:hypothetical protein
MFVWLISHQPTVLFSRNKSAINNQLAVFSSQNKPAPAISHQPNEQAIHTNSAPTTHHTSQLYFFVTTNQHQLVVLFLWMYLRVRLYYVLFS